MWKFRADLVSYQAQACYPGFACMAQITKVQTLTGKTLSILPDPAIDTSASALPAAVAWAEQLLLGSLGTVLAVLAIAWLGIAMLQGRFPARDGLRVILGCFILFGAPAIAQGFLHAMRGETQSRQVYSAPPVAPVALPAKPPQFDPYAGASVPRG